MPRNRSHLAVAGALFAVVVCAAPAFGRASQDGAGQTTVDDPPRPSVEDVYVVMRDMDLAYENVQIRTIVPTEGGVSALVGLIDGTLVDVELAPVARGWTLRDIYYVAGDAAAYSLWTGPWRTRVAEAERFLAAASDDPNQPQRRAEELAPLVWFEDIDESDRLWGMNPTTYRIMQTLRMMPILSGPMGPGRNQ